MPSPLNGECTLVVQVIDIYFYLGHYVHSPGEVLVVKWVGYNYEVRVDILITLTPIMSMVYNQPSHFLIWRFNHLGYC